MYFRTIKKQVKMYFRKVAGERVRGGVRERVCVSKKAVVERFYTENANDPIHLLPCHLFLPGKTYKTKQNQDEQLLN